MNKLFTIGYEGSTVDDVLATLTALNVEVLADVRQLPISRKKGLSKNKLAAHLNDVGIEYLHFRSLGDPKEGRDAAKSGDFTKFESIYLSHLSTEEAQVEYFELLRVAKTRRTCMLCFERCAIHCHRSYIADAASIHGFEVFNLVAGKANHYQGNEAKLPRYNPRQSLTAAE